MESGTETRIMVTVNGDERQVEAGLTVRRFLESVDLHPGLVVVEHNREILDREHYDAVEIREGDVLELVHFVGGG